MLLQLGHAVLAVGFGWEDDVPYIVIRNSWTNEWGEGGYIRLKNNKDAQGWTDYSGPCGASLFTPWKFLGELSSWSLSVESSQLKERMRCLRDTQYCSH